MQAFEFMLFTPPMITAVVYFFATECFAEKVKKHLNFVGGLSSLFAAVFWVGSAYLGCQLSPSAKILLLAAQQNYWAAIAAYVAALCFIPVFILEHIGLQPKASSKY